MYPHVFQPGRIGTLELESRLVFPPMQTRATDERGFPTKRLADFLVRRAHGMGLMIVQHSFCWEGSGIERGMDISLDRSIPYLEKLVRAVKATGTKVGIQIGGRTLRQKGNVCYAPSSIPISFEERLPTEISKEQICGYLEAYARAAARIRAAGFDVIELHGLTGKLLAQFLSPYFNRRSDEYGGSLENRTRFPREVMEAIHSAAGKDFPIIFGLTVDEGLEGGVTPQNAAGQARLLEQGARRRFSSPRERRKNAGMREPCSAMILRTDWNLVWDCAQQPLFPLWWTERFVRWKWGIRLLPRGLRILSEYVAPSWQIPILWKKVCVRTEQGRYVAVCIAVTA